MLAETFLPISVACHNRLWHTRAMDDLFNAAAIMGRAGGLVKVAKGFSRLSDEKRSAMAQKGGQARWSGKTRVEQFWDNVNKASGVFKIVNGELSECWVWTAGRSNKGYGYFSVNGEAKQAYKVAYEWEKGPVPDGLHLDHLCRTHECIRPDHQEPVSREENSARGDTPAGRKRRGGTTCREGHEFDGVNANGARTCSACNSAMRKRLRDRDIEGARQRGREYMREWTRKKKEKESAV